MYLGETSVQKTFFFTIKILPFKNVFFVFTQVAKLVWSGNFHAQISMILFFLHNFLFFMPILFTSNDQNNK